MSSYLLNSFWFEAVTPGTTTTTTTLSPGTTTTTTTVAGIRRTFTSFPYTASRSTRNSTAYLTIGSVLAAATASSNTAVFWMANSDINDTTFDTRIQLVSGSTVIQLNNMEPQDTTDRMSMGGMFPYASITNSTWSIQQSIEDNGATGGYSGYAVVALRLTGSETYTSSSVADSTTSTTYQTKTSITLGSGSYIVVGSAAIGTNNLAGNPRFRIFDGTNTFGEILDAYAQDIATRSPYFHVFRRLITGTTTYNLQYRGDGTNQGIILQASMLALDLGRFRNNYYAENTGSFSTTSTTYVNAFTASFNIANPSNQHLLLASAMLSGSSTTDSFACKLRNNTTAIDYCVEHLREPNATSEELPTVVARTVTFTGATNEIAWQLDVETAATTGHLKNMMIVLLDLGTT